MVISDFKFASATMLHHHSQTLDDDFGAWPNKNPVFASLFSIVYTLESISLNIHVHHYGSVERWWEESLSYLKNDFALYRICGL